VEIALIKLKTFVMKKNIPLLSMLIAFIAFSNSCKKDSDNQNTKTYKEDFVDVFSLGSKGWVFKDNSSPYSTTTWKQGYTGIDKSGIAGFSAYSYKSDEDEYAYGGYYSFTNDVITISTWMITPIYEIKNGDKLIFYTRAAPNTNRVDRLQVRLNETDNTAEVGTTATSVGKFTMLLKEVNEAMAVDAYPQAWTKYEIIIAGLNGPKQSRIAFRYFIDGLRSNAIGVDAFSLTSL
jgi:hypothetical protein